MPEGDELRARYARDLSEGGLMISTRDVLPVDSEVEIELFAPAAEEPIRLLGRVARIAIDQSSGKSVPVGMGVKLLGLSDDAAERLAGLIAAYGGGAADEEDTPTDPEAVRQLARALRDHLANVLARIEDLKDELELYRVDDRASSAVVDRLWTEKRALQDSDSDEQSEASEALERLNHENAALRKELERAMEERRAALDELEAAVADSRKTADLLDRQHIDAVEASRAELAEAEEKADRLRQRLDDERARTLDAEEASRRRVDEARERARQVEQELAELLAQSERRRAEARARAQQLRDELADQNGAIAALRTRVGELEQALSRSKSSFQRLRAKRRDMERFLAMSQQDAVDRAPVELSDDDLSVVDNLLEERTADGREVGELRLGDMAVVAPTPNDDVTPAETAPPVVDESGERTEEPDAGTEARDEAEVQLQTGAAGGGEVTAASEPDDLPAPLPGEPVHSSGSREAIEVEPEQEPDPLRNAIASAKAVEERPVRVDLGRSGPDRETPPDSTPATRAEPPPGIARQSHAAEMPTWRPSPRVIGLTLGAILATAVLVTQTVAPDRLPWGAPASSTPADTMPVEQGGAVEPEEAAETEEAVEPEEAAEPEEAVEQGEAVEPEEAVGPSGRPDESTEAGSNGEATDDAIDASRGAPGAESADEAPGPVPDEVRRKQLINAGVAAMRKGRSRAAIRPLTGALQLGEDAGLLALLGQACYESHRIDEARRFLERAVELNPRNARAFRLLGNVYAFQERNQAAMRAYRRFLTLVPTGPRADDVRTAVEALETLETLEETE
jgi:Tfp pilus assembly protein PilZ